jgi:hypothetical protein
LIYKPVDIPLEKISVGLEVESTAVRETTRGKIQRVNTWKHLGPEGKLVPGGGSVINDAWTDSVEWGSPPCLSHGEMQEAASRWIEWIQQEYGWKLVFDTKTPFTENTTVRDWERRWPPKPRLRALIKAIKAEHDLYPDSDWDWESAYGMSTWACIQVHLGLNPDTFFGNTLRNIFEHCGPYMAKVLSERYDLDNLGHQSSWTFVHPERRQLRRWLKTPTDHAEYLRRIPRFLKELPNGKWVVDLETPSMLGDEASEGGLYWGTRGRKTDRFGAHGTLEIRPPFPCMEPEKAVDVAFELRGGAHTFLEMFGDVCFESPEHAERQGVFNLLSGRSDLFPDHCLTEEEWETLYNR